MSRCQRNERPIAHWRREIARTAAPANRFARRGLTDRPIGGIERENLASLKAPRFEHGQFSKSMAHVSAEHPQGARRGRKIETGPPFAFQR
jgi:hypothetical protein